MTQPDCPSVIDVDATAAVADPIRRNRQITEAYSRLSRAFAEWLPHGANWCTFARWASRQAGNTIRKEDLQHVVASHLRERLRHRRILSDADRRLGASIDRIAALAGEVARTLPGIDRASAAVAAGNRKVFAEIGREFARFLNGDRDAIANFTTVLRDGPPPDGQGLLRRAFTNYHVARSTLQPSARAQLILLANIQIGLHEQTRLQPEIREAMDAALLDAADTRRRILERLDELLADGPLGRVHTGPGRRLVNAVADEIADVLRSVVRVVITDHLMSIGFPHDRTLRLGSDVTIGFPQSLSRVTNPELVTLLREYDFTPNTPSGSGAVDWSVLQQRVHFIADLFRGYQEDATLFDEPVDARPTTT